MRNQIDGLIIASFETHQILLARQSSHSLNRQLKPAFVQTQLRLAEKNLAKQLHKRRRHKLKADALSEFSHQSNLWAFSIVSIILEPPHFLPESGGDPLYATLPDGRVATLSLYGDLLYILVASTTLPQIPTLFHPNKHQVYRAPQTNVPSEFEMGLVLTNCLANIRHVAKKLPEDTNAFVKYYSKIALSVDAFLWGKGDTIDQEYAMFHFTEQG